MSFTPWTLLIDVGIVSLLLLLGKLLRAKVAFIQRLFIPPSLIAGFCGLILGPEVLGWLPLSSNMGTYAGILIALVFSCIPFTSSKSRSNDGGSRIGRVSIRRAMLYDIRSCAKTSTTICTLDGTKFIQSGKLIQ